MKPVIDYSLYLIADRLSLGPRLEEAVSLAIQGGGTVVQLREKAVDARTFFASACALKAVTDHYGVPLIINDRADIALAVEAAGVHLGPDDLPVKNVRKLIGKNMLLGVSVGTCQEALAAEKEGADYLSVGALYPTATKVEAQVIALKEMEAICQTVQLPVLGVGGITLERAFHLAGKGLAGICSASAILCAQDILAAAKAMRGAHKTKDRITTGGHSQ